MIYEATTTTETSYVLYYCSAISKGRTSNPRHFGLKLAARQMFRGWAAARPSSSHFQKIPARPGPAHHLFKILGPARLGPSHGNEAHETRALYGSAGQLRGPARGFEGPAHGPAHVLPVLKGAGAYANVIL